MKTGIVPSIFFSVDSTSNNILSSIDSSNSDHTYAKCLSNPANKSVRRELFIENIDIKPYELNAEHLNKRLKLLEVFFFNLVILLLNIILY